MNGEGVALGWSALCRGHLTDGRLVRLGSAVLALEERYHILTPTGRDASAPTQLFLSWPDDAFNRSEPA